MRASLRTTIVVALAFAGATIAGIGTAAQDAEGSLEPSHDPAAQTAKGVFHDAMRKLWEDHITWTRQYIVSTATGPTDLPDIESVTQRLLANQVDIGDAVKPFYGDAAGEQLTALLTDHILTAAEIIANAEAGDTVALDDASARWYANGDEIATFLNAANPANWPFDLLAGHMRTHLDLTLAEAVARLEGRYEDGIAAYEQVHAQILAMADMLSDGIIDQFPEHFGD